MDKHKYTRWSWIRTRIIWPRFFLACVEIGSSLRHRLVRHQAEHVYRDSSSEVLTAGRSGVNSGEIKSLATEIKVVNQRTQGLGCGCKMIRSLGLSQSWDDWTTILDVHRPFLEFLLWYHRSSIGPPPRSPRYCKVHEMLWNHSGSRM